MYEVLIYQSKVRYSKKKIQSIRKYNTQKGIQRSFKYINLITIPQSHL